MHRQVATVFLLLGFAGFVAVGCADRFNSMITKRAASDFQCSEAEIQVEEQESSTFYGKFDASGCGQSDTYVTNCSLFGVCNTMSSAEVAAHDAAIEQQRAAQAQARESAPPPPTPSSASSSSSESSESESSLPPNCGFNSDCDPGVKCNSRRCANTEGSSCGFDSDCGGNGAKCNSGKCSNAPDGKCGFNSECPGGSCSSGKCRF